MSDRLIREQDVIDALKETGIIQDDDLGHLVVDEIKRIPTAYDVDKVVEQIEHYNECTDKCTNYEYCGDFCKDIHIDKDEAIGIVKKGGADE